MRDMACWQSCLIDVAKLACSVYLEMRRLRTDLGLVAHLDVVFNRSPFCCGWIFRRRQPPR